MIIKIHNAKEIIQGMNPSEVLHICSVSSLNVRKLLLRSALNTFESDYDNDLIRQELYRTLDLLADRNL
jgi:hypothetical protein